MVNDDSARKNAQFGASDWTRLASQALDMWQNHLTTLANDPKAKEEMARLIEPMSQMYTGWVDMMQNFAEKAASKEETAAASEESCEAESTQEPASPDITEAAPSSSEEKMEETSEENSHDESDIEISSEPAPADDAGDDEPVCESAMGPASSPAADAAEDDASERDADPFASLAELSSIARSFGRADAEIAGESRELSREPERAVTESHANLEPELRPSVEEAALPADSFLPEESGNTSPADRSRSLAELAERLANLEQELDSIRGSRTKRSGAAGDAGSSDIDFRDLAGTRQTRAS